MNNKYETFFYESRRASSKTGKKVKVIKEDRIRDFLNKIDSDKENESRFNALIILLFCGGMRISEALNIKKQDIVKKDGYFLINIKVLKKKISNGAVERSIVVPGDFAKSLNFLLQTKRPGEYIFNRRGVRGQEGDKLTRQRALYYIRKILNIDCHSLRHSNVSFLISRDLTDIKIAKILEMSVKNVANYTHLHQESEMKKLYAEI